MGTMRWAACFVTLVCLISMSNAFVRQRRSPIEEENKPTDDVAAPEQPEEVENTEDSLKTQVRKRRQWNSLDSAIREVFSPQFSQPYDNRVERRTYDNQQQYVSNNFIPQQKYNNFPVYGPPSYQPNDFIQSAPVINNHYLPSTANWFPRPFYCYYPIVITLPPYRPPQMPNMPTNNNNNNNNNGNNNGDESNEVNPTLGNKFGADIPQVDPNAYNTTSTGISLVPIRPVRPPTITAPPVERPELGGQPTPRPTQPTTTRRPQIPTLRPTQPPPQNSYNPPQGNSLVPNYPVAYPEDIPEEDFEPSPCVRAIVGCCLPNRRRRVSRERCFEINGCPGAFFDSDPCRSPLAIEASRAAMNFLRRG